MSGRFFPDTNAIIKVLAGHTELLDVLHEADHIATSIICELEFLSFPQITTHDKELLRNFLKRIMVVGLNTDDTEIKELIISVRAAKRVKLPDAIIVASAIRQQSVLITADAVLLGLNAVQTMSFEP